MKLIHMTTLIAGLGVAQFAVASIEEPSLPESVGRVVTPWTHTPQDPFPDNWLDYQTPGFIWTPPWAVPGDLGGGMLDPGVVFPDVGFPDVDFTAPHDPPPLEWDDHWARNGGSSGPSMPDDAGHVPTVPGPASIILLAGAALRRRRAR
jgi:hypothetical protein